MTVPQGRFCEWLAIRRRPSLILPRGRPEAEQLRRVSRCGGDHRFGTAGGQYAVGNVLLSELGSNTPACVPTEINAETTIFRIDSNVQRLR